MACVALASLKATLELEFLQPIPRIPHHHHALIHSFFESISSMQAFLEKKSSGGGGAIKDLEIEIRDFALKAEDHIEIQLRNFILAKLDEDRESQEKASLKLHKTLEDAAENATELLKIINIASKQVDEDNETQPQPSIQHASASENHKSDGSSSWRSPKLVGRVTNHDRRVIIERLTRGGSSMLTLISIVGMVGIGKTALAESVYADPIVEQHFDLRGWITLPQEYNKGSMMHALHSISLAVGNKIEKGSTAEQLAKQVRGHLIDRKYLIVLDNLQDSRTWNDIQSCFPSEWNGSRILLTTRHSDRKYYFGSSYKYIPKMTLLNMTLLDPDESWDLFCHILSLEEKCWRRYEIVDMCDGLPLAIIAIAKLLSKYDYIIEIQWPRIINELSSLGILDYKALLTSDYNQLSQHLKVCFLYLGVFPKHYAIRVKAVIRLWIAEGFLKPLEPEGLENQAYAYMQELIDRSLVLIKDRSSDGNIKTFRVHSAIHAFCVRKALEEGILCPLNPYHYPSSSIIDGLAFSCRWLSLCSNGYSGPNSHYYLLFGKNIPRSIFYYFAETDYISVQLNLLRVLSFVPSYVLQRVQLDLRDLIFLRYLSVTQWFEGLDTVLSASLNLQTIVVSDGELKFGAHTLHLPSTIWELPRLRHLELGNMYTIDPPSVVKEKLQTLSWVGPSQHRKEVYFSFPNIKKLKIFYKEDLEPNNSHESCSNPIILDNLDYLKWLERLTISSLVGCTVTLPEPPMFPLQLKKLRLSGANLSKRDLTVIGRLPELRVLKLENALLGSIWEVAEGEFCKLRFLLLEDKKVKQLMFAENSFTSLERLVLKYCYCLKEITHEFASSRTLQSVEFRSCNPSAIASAKRIQGAQPDFGVDKFEIIIHGAVYDDEV